MAYITLSQARGEKQMKLSRGWILSAQATSYWWTCLYLSNVGAVFASFEFRPPKKQRSQRRFR